MAEKLRYDGQAVVITGAGAGLGKQYAKFFASRGAKIVVNDLGGSFNGVGGGSAKVADLVVEELKKDGYEAVANYDSVENGDRIIATAIKAYGRVDVLINNAGILRDITIRNMKDSDWDIIHAVHLHGAYKTTRAAWPHFRKQRYGRVINTSSSSGLFGNFGQSNYASAKMALVGFTETLAKEGLKYDIRANVLAPGAASRLTATVWPSDMMEVMKPDWVVPLVGVLCHPSCKETGSIFEAAAGHFAKIRWERSKGVLLNPDDSMTASALSLKWNEIRDFSTGADHADRTSDSMDHLKRAMALPRNKQGSPVNFKGRAVLVTGAGDGLGRAYAKEFGKLRAKVAVNDVTDRAESVAKEIRDAGGEAIAIKMSVEKGDEIVKKVVDKFGRIDVLVNNAGILRDKAFVNMTDDLWFQVYNVHLKGTYKTVKAVWPFMMKQKYGRIVNITSTSGIYGNFGQANYAAAKCAIIGFSKAISREGQKYNILVNTVAPSAGTNMTRTIRPESEVQALRPDYVAPLVALLCSENCPQPNHGCLYEAGAGWFAATRWERARGVDFPHEDGVPSIEAVKEKFAQICDFGNGLADWPDSPADGSKYSMANVMRNPKIQKLNTERKRESTKGKL